MMPANTCSQIITEFTGIAAGMWLSPASMTMIIASTKPATIVPLIVVSGFISLLREDYSIVIVDSYARCSYSGALRGLL